MKKKVLSTFDEQGYYLTRGLFSQRAISCLEKEFDKIEAMKKSGLHESVRCGKNSDIEFQQMEEKLNYLLPVEVIKVLQHLQLMEPM